MGDNEATGWVLESAAKQFSELLFSCKRETNTVLVGSVSDVVSGLEFDEEKVQVGRANISVATCQLDNGYLILVSDGEYRFGTVAVGVPTPFGEISPTATSCLVGTRFQAAVRAIADIAALKLGGIVFVSLFLSREGEAYVESVLETVRRLIVKKGEAEESSQGQD